MLLHTRAGRLGYTTEINTREIARTSRMVSRLTGYPVQPNKAIVGRNAFAHESGIHQDGMLKDRSTYEIMDATTVGLEGNDLVLGKHSGRHALKSALQELGYASTAGAQHRVQALQGDRRPQEAGHRDGSRGARDGRAARRAADVRARVVRGRRLHAAPAARARRGHAARRRDGPGDFTGDGPVDAIFRAINAAVRRDARLREFRIDAVTGGQDALGEASVVLELVGPVRLGPGRVDGHHRGRRACLRARARERRAQGAGGGRGGHRRARARAVTTRHRAALPIGWRTIERKPVRRRMRRWTP